MCQRGNIGTITVHGLCSAIKVKVKDPVMSPDITSDYTSNFHFIR